MSHGRFLWLSGGGRYTDRAMRKFAVALVLLLGLGLGGACAKTEETPDALMKTGTDALYTKRDYETAVKAFRKVLEKNPTHYGATYQLGVALDRAGKRAEANPLWEKTLQMAERNNDKATADTARKRLGWPAPRPEDAAMKDGLDALYAKKNPEAAAMAFRNVLEQNPTHYGATYQLATALDRSGKRPEARPLWEKVLKMAEGYKDQKTVDAARQRLAQQP